MPCRERAHAPCGKKATAVPAAGARKHGRPARLVRPGAARPAVAGQAGTEGRRLSRVALGDHAAADDRVGRHTLLQAVSRTLADSCRTGGSTARRRARCMGGPRLLQPRAQSAQMRPAGGRGTRRPFPRQRGRPARVARHRPLHGSGHRCHRLRRGDHAGRWQHRARYSPAVRRPRSAAWRQAADSPPGADAHARPGAPAMPPRP